MSRGRQPGWFSSAAIFLSAAGLLVPPLAVIAIAMGIIATRQSRSAADARRGKFAIGLSCTGLTILGGMLLVRSDKPASDVECQIGLQALNLAQDAHRKTRGRYATTSDELGLPITGQYFLSSGGEHEAELQKLKVGKVGQCPDCSITMACLEDGTRTWWTITSGGKPTVHPAP